jgi:hypothetical protein
MKLAAGIAAPLRPRGRRARGTSPDSVGYQAGIWSGGSLKYGRILGFGIVCDDYQTGIETARENRQEPITTRILPVERLGPELRDAFQVIDSTPLH